MVVTQKETQSYVFYHGTGAASAQAILSFGGQGTWLESIGARSLGREIRDAIVAVTGISLEQARRLTVSGECRGVECRSAWVPALLISDNETSSNGYCYDHFCGCRRGVGRK